MFKGSVWPGNSVFFRELAHPAEVLKPGFHRQIEINPGQFFAESAHMEISPYFVNANEFFPRPRPF